ncbi:hypothetical protein [Pedobacter heparinus]|uniref:Uncharacterized protein n=1 Tax=Pedobacter heparinus (strain ATCC 13125 / DSM 2366 / CIP 104194 / JCM 7457 / NBRC 12017 / NCIMB 9290 / NRRL B-14731 / HIM 762-3) TaxID=485917 RepID=C6Y3K3_PEDHD|nr:hypothetical protein [Pedobacter heparinus]ACU03282.1 hypothetical protein Phep_1063 [Pedobacter heparinus DSM 2366]
MKNLIWVLIMLGSLTVRGQNTPVFNGKQMIDVSRISPWDFTTRPAGWYRIAKVLGGARANATFELREGADHSTLRFEIGVNYNSSAGSSFTLTNHSYYMRPTFPKIRLLNGGTYNDAFLEVYVDPHNNNDQHFDAYIVNPLAEGDWQLVEWTIGDIPSGYVVTEYNTDKLFSVGNNPNGNILSVGRDGNVGIGTISAAEKLAVKGNIRAKEVKVENANWPDYVFTKYYQLPTLQQTENHIKEKGHLPGIPSASEVKANGIDLGDMNAKLLQKIEELTLHLIEKDSELKLQKGMLNKQQLELNKQQEQINSIMNKLK